jgi:hypothetical protein
LQFAAGWLAEACREEGLVPQLLFGTKPIDTTPTAAVPIMVKTIRRERFMAQLLRPLNG